MFSRSRFGPNGHGLTYKEFCKSHWVTEHVQPDGTLPDDIYAEISRLAIVETTGQEPYDISTIPIAPIYDPPPGAATRTVTVSVDGHQVHLMFWVFPQEPVIGILPHYFFKTWCDEGDFEYKVFELSEYSNRLVHLSFPTVTPATIIFVRPTRSHTKVQRWFKNETNSFYGLVGDVVSVTAATGSQKAYQLGNMTSYIHQPWYLRAADRELLLVTEFSDDDTEMDDELPGYRCKVVTVTLDNHFIHFMFWMHEYSLYCGDFPMYECKHWCEPCTDTGPRMATSEPPAGCVSLKPRSAPQSPLTYEVIEANYITGRFEVIPTLSMGISLVHKIYVRALQSRNMVEVPVPLESNLES
ncbi:hypothetical protein FISHEDRAFT_59998 [Fistulina hepatica ATCC 64428]|uniref:Uncharacterized protein n=1 Tax=Fistulina hepatica ATCC 64428 TaxID=1128425 RepID=A0A0D7A861_9AGAR|nr:hypothetical protein FISHEDRAFT_59998 [Fistulina hepatica ATCC 64428]